MWIRRRRKIVGAVLLAIVALLLLNRALSHSVAPAPSWNGITPGLTTRSEVREILGEPEQKWICIWPHEGTEQSRQIADCLLKFWIVNYGYSHKEIAEYQHIFHQIYFDARDRVEYLVVITWPDSDYGAMTADDMVSAYGRPERVAYSMRAVRSRAILYCEQGLILHAIYLHDGSIGFREKVYFSPMSTEDCSNRFFNEVAIKNPAPDSDIKGSLDPWGFNDPTVQEE